MIAWLKKILIVLIAAMAGLWIATQLPWGQRFVKSRIERALSTPEFAVSIDHIDVALPLFISLHGITVSHPLQRDVPLLTCQSLTVSPLLVDLPFKRLTFLRVRGLGVFVDLDAIEALEQKDSFSPQNSSFPFTLSIRSLRISSVYLKSHRLPMKEKACDCSLKGRFFLSADHSHATTFLSISRNTPMLWPKRLDVKLSKEQRDYSLLATIFLSTEGLGQPKEGIFGPGDKLQMHCEASLADGASDFSPRALEKCHGSWTLSCPLLSTPLFHDYLLRRSVFAGGMISYLPGEKLSVTCDDFTSVLTLGRTIQAISDMEGPPAVPHLQFEPLRSHTIRMLGGAQLSTNGNDGLRLRLELPSLSVDDVKATLDGTFDFASADGGLQTKGAAKGTVFVGKSNTPWQFSGDGLIASRALTLAGDLVASSFRLSARYDVKEAEKGLWTTLRCNDLSIFQPFVRYPVGGSVDLSSRLAISPKKSLISLSGTLADVVFDTVSCKNGELRLSTDTETPDTISCVTSLMGLTQGPLLLDSGRATIHFNPMTQSLRLLEARFVGGLHQLGFDLFASGDGHTDGKKGFMNIDRMEGTLGGSAISLEHPLRCEHSGLSLSLLSGTIRVGQEGRIDGLYQRPTLLQATGDLSLERLPLQHVTAAVGCMQSSGIFDGQCHYQSSSRAVTATAHAHANVARLGVIGGAEGGIALGGEFSIDNNIIQSQICIAGMGIKEPLMVCLSSPVTRSPKSPWITISRDNPLRGTIKGDIHLSQLLAGWMPSDAGFEAVIGCDVLVGGTVESPLFHGPVHLRDGRVDLLPTGEVISDIQMDGTLENRQLTFSHITATDEKQGQITGSGVLEITQNNDFHWKATLKCADVEVVALDYASVIADGAVTLEGDLSGITISGSAIAKKALIDLAARFPSDVPEIAVTYRNETQEESHPYLVFFDLSLDGTSPIEIKGRGLSSLWEGHLHLGGEVSHLVIDGTLRCRKGTFLVSTKELTISEGTISFAGDLFTDSRLNVIANITLPTITAQVCLKGSFKAPRLALQSTPPKTDNEILSLVLFNKEYGDISPLQSLQLANTAMTLQRSSGPFGLLDKLKETLGIDLIDLGSSTPGVPPSAASAPSNLDQDDTGPPSQQSQNDVSLKVGKYISDGVAVTVSKNVTSDATLFGVEAQLAPGISAEAEVSDDQEGIVSLKWKKNY